MTETKPRPRPVFAVLASVTAPMTYSATSDFGGKSQRRPSRFKFLFKVLCMTLPLGFFALSRANPELHQEMMFKAVGVVSMVMGTEEQSSGNNSTMAQRFGDKVKVNRFGNSGGNAFGNSSSSTTATAKEQADQLGSLLSGMKAGG